MIRFLFFLAAFTVTLADTQVEGRLKKQKSQLEEMKRSMLKERKAMESLAKKRAGILQKVHSLSDNLIATENYLTRLDSTGKVLNQSLEESQHQLTAVDNRVSQRNKVLAQRMRTLFMRGKKNTQFPLPEPDREVRWMRWIFFNRRLMEYDRMLISAARQDREKKKEAHNTVKNKLKETENFKKRKSTEVDILTKEKNQLTEKQAQLQLDEEAKKKLLKSMEENAAALEAIVKSLEEKERRDLARGKQAKKLNRRGSFCYPVSGIPETQFGLQYHKTLKTATRNLGVEYLAKPGENIQSAADGEVVYIGPIPGYGDGVILSHGTGYYSIYGNLSRVLVNTGQKLKGCHQIAAVPLDGIRKDRRVYFEVREGKKSIDPVNWLKKMIN